MTDAAAPSSQVQPHSESRVEGGKLRPGGRMWHDELFNLACRAFKIKSQMSDWLEKGSDPSSASILTCPLKKVGPNIIWSFIMHLELDQFYRLFKIFSQSIAHQARF